MNYFVDRPSRMIPASQKDKAYHLQYAKWALNAVNMSNYNAFIYKSIINWAFARGEQWLFHEDLDLFLLDESGESRNRIKFVQNIIRPFIEYYTGSVIRMDIAARAFSISSQAVDRREMAMKDAEMLYEVYQQAPELVKKTIRQKYPVIGDTKEETFDIAKNLYRDVYEEEVNDIINYLAERNDMEEKKVLLTKHIAIDGIGILKEFERFGSQYVEVIDPRRMILDYSAKLPDFRDSEFMGDWKLSSIADIIEEIPELSVADKLLLEKAARETSTYTGMHSIMSYDYNMTNGKLPEYYIEWRDIERSTFGAVLDDNSVPALVCIDSEYSEYTEKDLIPESELKKYAKENFWIEKILKFKNKKKVDYDVVRYCRFVPCEVAGTKEDFVLKYGIKEYCPKMSLDYKHPNWSYMMRCWNYDNGIISSPIDDLISPQRFINRLISMGESHINNTRGSGIIIDKNVIDNQSGGEEELQRNMNLGKAVMVDGPVNNSVSTYNNQVGTGTLQLFDIARTMKAMADNVIGGGDALMGQGGAYRASATVASQNLNQGTTMQEPVFYAVHKIFLNTYNSFANRGRRILSANQSKLIVAVGEIGMRHITLTRDFELEEFRCVIKRSNSPEQERDMANQQLMLLLDKKLIDQNTFAKYFNRSTLSSIGKAIREYTMLVIERRREIEKAQQAEAEKAHQVSGAMMQMANLQEDKADSLMAQQVQMQENERLQQQLLEQSMPQKGLS